MAKNKSMHKARAEKNDEFYTQLSDIENELKHYKKHFKGKTVLCNCDDPLESEFVRYFAMNFEHLGLKKLIATHFVDSARPSKKSPYKLVYTGDKNGNRMPDADEFITSTVGDGDFRSDECLELLDEADIVVTNPPFSLFREFISLMMERKKKFLVIGNMNAITYKETFSLIAANKLWLGVNFNKTMEFAIPDSYTKHSHVDETGKKIAKVPAICWFTNLHHAKRAEKLGLYKKYTKEEYPQYDNYKAINVDKVADIPMNYKGAMGVPITFLGKYNPKQFEILGLANSARWIGYECLTIIRGKKVYNRIIIRRIPS